MKGKLRMNKKQLQKKKIKEVKINRKKRIKLKKRKLNNLNNYNNYNNNLKFKIKKLKMKIQNKIRNKKILKIRMFEICSV